ncbi:hypothetical protein [Kutzneria buriramensis]|uniref:Uncharacterized protein n=1 Tax=Kutzneria buriramensis TaxID=1045776 RepID=A0A3E0HGI3_9PSEU|nr:hypothetical protein [Kutzneria buriramensis]REH44925.1 hypothetical protein BCF44_108406 [Kutzneria buriramensis]
MNEQELRGALRDAMAEVVPPRPVTANSALTRAHRAQRRRRANLAGIGVGAVVVALVAGAVTLNSHPWEGTAEPSPPSNTHTSAPPLTGGESDNAPVGSPEYARGKNLLAAVPAALPSGLVPASGQQLTGAKFDPRRHEEIQAGPSKQWIYRAREPVARPGQPGVGEVDVQVFGPGNGLPIDVCAAAQNLTHGAACTLKQVGGKSVALVSHPDDTRLGAAAVYRYADGTVVGVVHSSSVYGAGLPGLAQPPLTDDQLANLALSPGFKVV